MKLQPVKIYRPDAEGNLKLVKVISQAEVIKLAEEKTFKKNKWKKKHEIKRNENKQVPEMPEKL